jgi:hypothetical protein
MLRTNADKIVEFLLPCQPGPPRTTGTWQVGHTGEPFILPAIGGITLNVRVGDSAFGLAGDHIEPGVSCTANAEKPTEFPNPTLQLFACVGNSAKLISGEAKGAQGVVTGHHGGSEHVMIDFAPEVMEQMSYEDKVLIRARGQGLKLLDYPEIRLFNLDPEFLHKLGIAETNGTLQVPVTTKAPAVCMGSGLGRPHVASGDYDIMTSDPQTVADHKLDQIRFGDIVALMDHDNAFGRAYRQGAVTIGIVVHSDCLKAGHGPGVATLMTCPNGRIRPIIDSNANIANYLKIGIYR